MSPRSSGDRAPPSGGGCVGSNPTGGAHFWPRFARPCPARCARRDFAPRAEPPRCAPPLARSSLSSRRRAGLGGPSARWFARPPLLLSSRGRAWRRCGRRRRGAGPGRRSGRPRWRRRRSRCRPGRRSPSACAGRPRRPPARAGRARPARRSVSMFFIAASTPRSMKPGSACVGADLAQDAAQQLLLVGRPVEVAARQRVADPAEDQRLERVRAGCGRVVALRPHRVGERELRVARSRRRWRGPSPGSRGSRW